MLNETRFEKLYRCAQELHAMGADAAAREIYFYLFDFGTDAGGYGVVRLTFVLHELGDLAQPAGGGKPGSGDDREAQRAWEGLEERRDAREAVAKSGEAGFRELQEMVALNRAMGEPERSFELYRSLHKQSAGGDPNAELSSTVRTLGELVREELVPRDPERLARAIFHQRLRARVAEMAAVASALLAGRAVGGDRPGGHDEAETPRAGRLQELGTESHALAEELLQQARRAGSEAPEEMVTFCREVKKVFDPPRLRAALVHDEAGRQHLTALVDESRELVQRHALDPAEPPAEQLHARVVDLAGEVAETIAGQRVTEDFALPTVAGQSERSIAGYVETKVRGDGLLVFEVLLRIGEEALAERLSSWLLAYRQDEEMYMALIAAARRAGHQDLVDRLNEEAQRALVGGG